MYYSTLTRDEMIEIFKFFDIYNCNLYPGSDNL